MKSKKEIYSIFVRFAIVLVLTLPIALNEYKAHFQMILYAALVYFPIYFALSGLYIMIVLWEVWDYIKNRSISTLIPSFTGLFILFIAISINIYHNSKINQENLIQFLSTEYVIQDDWSSLELKQNGSYVWSETIDRGLLTKYYYGTYSIEENRFIFCGSFPNLNKTPNNPCINYKFTIDIVDSLFVAVNENNEIILGSVEFIKVENLSNYK
jgi:uncharacterized membrane protein YqjE